LPRLGKTTRAKKPLHHVSINPMKDERLTDEQVFRICQRLEEKYGYTSSHHQRVIVEHIKDGRQHFHVMWHRVSFGTGQVVWPGHHWKKSKEAAREMEIELGLKRPVARRRLPRARIARRRKLKAKRKPKPRRRSRHGTRRPQTDPGDYLRLCKHPLRDLRLWLDEARDGQGRPRSSLHLMPARPWPRMGADDVLRPLRIARTVRHVEPEPRRPHLVAFAVTSSGMSEEQRIDYIAACDGKITWRQYFTKWGHWSLQVPPSQGGNRPGVFWHRPNGNRGREGRPHSRKDSP
jgi:hypothetical protein